MGYYLVEKGGWSCLYYNERLIVKGKDLNLMRRLMVLSNKNLKELENKKNARSFPIKISRY